MKNHEILAARIMPVGASGRPEMDGGLFLFPRMQRERIVNKVKFMYEAFKQETPEAADLDFFEEMPPVFHQMWLSLFSNPIPDMLNRDGHEMVITHVYFDVADPDALRAVLDTKSPNIPAYRAFWKSLNPKNLKQTPALDSCPPRTGKN